MPEITGKQSTKLDPATTWTVVTDSPLKGLSFAREPARSSLGTKATSFICSIPAVRLCPPREYPIASSPPRSATREA